jgi:hypothetical protein
MNCRGDGFIEQRWAIGQIQQNAEYVEMALGSTLFERGGSIRTT